MTALSRRAWGLVVNLPSAKLGETAPGADLGGSSNYSNENVEDRSGEGFRENSNWSRVSRF